MEESIESVTEDIANVSIRRKREKNIFRALQSRETGYKPAFLRDVEKLHLKRQRQNIKRRDQDAAVVANTLQNINQLVARAEVAPPEQVRMLNMLINEYDADLEKEHEDYYESMERLAMEPVNVAHDLGLFRDEDEVNYPIEQM